MALHINIIRRSSSDPHTPLTLLERLKLLLSGILAALIVGLVLAGLFIFGGLVLVLIGVAVVLAVIALIVRGAFRGAIR